VTQNYLPLCVYLGGFLLGAAIAFAWLWLCDLLRIPRSGWQRKLPPGHWRPQPSNCAKCGDTGFYRVVYGDKVGFNRYEYYCECGCRTRKNSAPQPPPG
jgi:hypothetical protein